MRYTQLTDRDVTEMLDTIGADSIEALFSTIPKEFLLQHPLNLPRGIGELELLGKTGAMASKNKDCTQQICFLGAGAYDHFIPTVVDALSGQTEFLTAYTPYQAEASQGLLQLFYEFQTMICLLTGMEVANASLYEFASAAAEAMLMAVGLTKRRQVLVSESVHPDTLRVLRTYARQQGIEIETVPTPEGAVDEEAMNRAISDATAAVIVQSPNFFGCIERLDRIVPSVHAHGALVIASIDPVSCGLLKPPGALDVDIAVGEGQALGIPLQYGGPYLGLLAGREKYLRRMPGRVVGMTRDLEGRRGYCLTLQTREQHIKRERATSNICTNQGLLAIRASIYMAAMGRRGLASVASQCFDKAHYAARQIAGLDGFELRFAAPFFKEFVVRTTRNVESVLDSCRRQSILAGVPLARFHKQHGDCFLVAVTEKRTRQEIDRLVLSLKEA